MAKVSKTQKVQYRRSVSFSPEDFLLVVKLCEKLEIPQTLLVSALIRTEAKKRKVRVTAAEVAAFKEEIRQGKLSGRRDEKRDRAAKLFPDAF